MTAALRKLCAIGAMVIVLGSSMPSLASSGKAKGRAQPQSASNSTGSLRVMSFNVRVRTIIDLGNHWNLRRELLVQTIRDFDPDLLGTQESLAAQSDYLRRQLPGYGFVGAGRDDGRRDGEMCGVFYRTSKFQKLDAGHFWLSEKPHKPGSRSWGSVFPRMVTWVKLRPRDGGRDFYFFNTHLDAFSSRAREQQSRLLRQQIERIAGFAPVVLTGDFNTDEGTGPYRVLTGTRSGVGAGLVDTLRAADPTPDRDEGTRHGFRGGKGGDRIDWILASRDFQPISGGIDRSRRGGRYPSDHFPVTAVLRWGTPVAAGPARETGG